MNQKINQLTGVGGLSSISTVTSNVLLPPGPPPKLKISCSGLSDLGKMALHKSVFKNYRKSADLISMISELCDLGRFDMRKKHIYVH